MTSPDESATVVAARYTANYWRRHLLKIAYDSPHPTDLGYRVGAHAISCILEALAGQTDPQQLGIGPDGADDLNALMAALQ